MTLQSAIDAELPFLRAEAESRMTSTANVRRPTGNTTTNADGFEVPEWATIHAGVPFRLGGSRSGDGGQHAVSVGGVEFSQATAVAHFPWDTTNLADNDYIEITTGEWAGTVLRIVEAVKGDQRTARRVPVVEVPRPTEWG